MSALPRKIRSLTVAEKFELLDAIWADLAVQAPAALSEEQSAELDRALSGTSGIVMLCLRGNT